MIVWAWLAALLLSVMAGVRLSVLFSYQGNDMMTSFQVIAGGISSGNEAVKASGKDGFWLSLAVFALLAAIHIARIMLDIYMAQRFMLRWRAWLTNQLTGDWLDGKAYYRTRFIDDTIDNPDQRIQADIDTFTAGIDSLPNRPSAGSTNTLLFGSIYSVASMISFTAILWNLSGRVTLPLVGIDLPRAIFWIGIVYVLFATVVAFWIGRPIIQLAFNNEKYNAAFRYALVRLRDASEAVAFYRGEIAERTGPAEAVRTGRVELPELHQPDDQVPGLEQLDRSSSGAHPLHRAIPTVLQRRDHPWRAEPDRQRLPQPARRVVLLPYCLRPIRRIPGRGHASPRAGRGERRGQGAAGGDHAAMCGRHGEAHRRRGPHTRWQSSSSTLSTCTCRWVTRWSSPGPRAAARRPCCAASPNCGPSPRAL